VSKSVPSFVQEQKELFQSNEIQELFEGILEQITFNLMNEAKVGDFDLLTKPTFVAKNSGVHLLGKGEKLSISTKHVTFE
jgi:hypothetical protein